MSKKELEFLNVFFTSIVTVSGILEDRSSDLYLHSDGSFHPRAAPRRVALAPSRECG